MEPRRFDALSSAILSGATVAEDLSLEELRAMKVMLPFSEFTDREKTTLQVRFNTGIQYFLLLEQMKTTDDIKRDMDKTAKYLSDTDKHFYKTRTPGWQKKLGLVAAIIIIFGIVGCLAALFYWESENLKYVCLCVISFCIVVKRAVSIIHLVKRYKKLPQNTRSPNPKPLSQHEMI